MADSVKCTVTDGIGSYLQYDFTAVTDCYVGIQIYLPAATLTAWLSGSFHDSPQLLSMQGAAGSPSLVEFVNLQDSDSDGTYDSWTGRDFNFDAAAVGGDAWHKTEVMWNSTNGDGPVDLTVDDVLLESVPFTSVFSDIGRVLIGAFQNHALAPASGDIYVARIKIGTTAGGSDILDFDGATAADLSAFTVVGTCALDTAPSSPPSFGGGADVTPPTLLTIKIADDTITLTYDEALQTSPGPDTSEFAVTVNGTARTVTAASVTGSTVIVTLSSPVVPGDTVKVSYTA